MTTTEIVRGDQSGGATTSHTIVVPALQLLLAEVGPRADAADYERAVLEENVLAKDTIESRRRTLRYLRELYVLRTDSLLFRALGDLWNDDPTGQPLLACLCALARDRVFRASAQAIFDSEPGDEVTSADLAGAGNLFGLGDRVKVSALVDRIEDLIAGRLLVFFPGEVEQNNYRLLNGRDGWNYHAVLITESRPRSRTAKPPPPRPSATTSRSPTSSGASGSSSLNPATSPRRRPRRSSVRISA